MQFVLSEGSGEYSCVLCNKLIYGKQVTFYFETGTIIRFDKGHYDLFVVALFRFNPQTTEINYGHTN